jgi:hypothetical protein
MVVVILGGIVTLGWGAFLTYLALALVRRMI